MSLHLIETPQEYEAAITMIEEWMDAGANSDPKMEELVQCVDHYEEHNFPSDATSPVNILEFYMDQNNIHPQDLVPLLGSLAKVNALLKGRTKLDRDIANNLETGLDLPTGCIAKHL